MNKQIQQNQFLWQRIAMGILLAVLLVYMVLPEFAYAGTGGGGGQLPTGSDFEVPGASSGDPWLKKFAFIIKFVVFLMCMAAVGLGLSDSIFSIFRVINDARMNGEWGPAIKQIGIILGGLIFALVIFALLNKYVIDPITNYGY